MSVISQLVQRADSWVNAMTGLGTLRDKLMHAQVVTGTKLSDSVLEALFNDDDVARRVVAKLPREATRRGFKLVMEGDPDSTKPADIARAMDTKLRALGAMPALRDSWIWARLYGGGSGVFVGAEDGRPVDQPLNEAAIRTVSFLNLVKRPQLSVLRRYEDIEAPEYGKPEVYTVSQAAAALAPRSGLEVHASRLILFDGALTARTTTDSPTGFDDSVLQNAMAPLQQTATAWQSVAHLMTDASQGVLKIANLVDLVASGGQETLRARIQLMDMARSVCRSILIDAEKESFERISTSFAGLPEVMDKLMMRMSAAAEQPVTLLYGRSAAGMNATGESDIRGWYDTVVEGQTDELKPRLERLLTLLFLAKDSPTRGKVPEDWSIEFNPLWQPTDKELADTKKVKADTYVALVGAQIMTDAEAGIGLAPDFPTIDVETRTELAEADAEGLRPREVNTPEPEPDPNAPGGGGDGGKEGGSGSAGPKAKADGGREPRADAQQRVPAGNPHGGEWTSSGGGGGAAAGKAPKATSAAADRLTDAQRAGIRKSLSTGKNAAVVAMQAKLVQRYGVPLAKAAVMYERDIKLQLKAAKAGKAGKAGERAEKQAAKKNVAEALTKPKAAAAKAIAAKGAADASAAAAAAAKAAGVAAKKAATAAKAKATREANKAKKKASAEQAKKAGADPVDAGTKNAPDPNTIDAGARIAAGVAGGGVLGGMKATTEIVRAHLDGAERTAPRYGIRDEDLSAKGYGGYNDGGVITLDTKQREALVQQREHGSVEDAKARVEHLEKERLEKGGISIRRELVHAREHVREARRQETATHVLVHEEVHSFGPMYSRRGLYHQSGVVAEEVATEVLARHITRGARARDPTDYGAYQGQVDGVLRAMRASTTKKRTHAEHFDVLVAAAKTYKKRTLSGNLMETLHSALKSHADDFDSDELRARLHAVPWPQ